jgi:hypothetical protein
VRGDSPLQQSLTLAAGAMQLALVVTIASGAGDALTAPAAAVTLAMQTAMLYTVWLDRGAGVGNLLQRAGHTVWFVAPVVSATACAALDVLDVFLRASASAHLIVFFCALLSHAGLSAERPQAWFPAAVASVYGSLRAATAWGERHAWYPARVTRLLPAAAALGQTAAMLLMVPNYRFGNGSHWFVAYATAKTTVFLLLPYAEDLI